MTVDSPPPGYKAPDAYGAHRFVPPGFGAAAPPAFGAAAPAFGAPASHVITHAPSVLDRFRVFSASVWRKM